ncbi:hypothetical protein AB0425_40975 [Actinosynnema sp. NPDC051121]
MELRRRRVHRGGGTGGHRTDHDGPHPQHRSARRRGVTAFFVVPRVGDRRYCVTPAGATPSLFTGSCARWSASIGRALPIEDWHELRASLLLARLATDEHAERIRLSGLVRLSTESRMDELPDHCRSVWETFLHLAGVNSAPASSPPALIFLGRVADEVRDPVLSAELRNWVRRWSDSLGLRSPESRQAELWRGSDEVVVSVDVDLVIQFDPDPTDRDRFVVSHWRNWGARGRHSARRADTIVGRADLEHPLVGLPRRP